MNSIQEREKNMDAGTCLKKLQYVGVLVFATVDQAGNPQIRNISAIHYEPDAIYFLLPEEKIFAGNYFLMGGFRYLDIQSIRR